MERRDTRDSRCLFLQNFLLRRFTRDTLVLLLNDYFLGKLRKRRSSSDIG